MDRKRLRVILIASFSGGLAWLGYPFISGQTIGYLLSSLVGKESTVYAAHYSERGFQKVTSGMHKSEVLDLVGFPLVRSIHCRNRTKWLWIWSDGRAEVLQGHRGIDEPSNDCKAGEKDSEDWIYTLQGNPTANHFYRKISLDAFGRVVDKVSSFDVD